MLNTLLYFISSIDGVCIRREKKDRNNEKDRLKKSRDDTTEDDHNWQRYGSGRGNRKMGSGQRPDFRHDSMVDRVAHDHDRWIGNQTRDRFVMDHKRDRFQDYQRPAYHRDRDHSRPDKRYVINLDYSQCLLYFIYFRSPSGKDDWRNYPPRVGREGPQMNPRQLYGGHYGPGFPASSPMYPPGEQQFMRDWRPERDYRRDYDRRQP